MGSRLGQDWDMDDDHELVLVAAYGNLESARADFGDLERRLKH